MSAAYPGHIVLVREYVISFSGEDFCKGSSYCLQPLPGFSSYPECIVQKLNPQFFNFLVFQAISDYLSIVSDFSGMVLKFAGINSNEKTRIHNLSETVK